MKLINILIIIFLLTITPCFAEFGSEVIVDGTGIQTDDDAELNSLDVLLYVKSSTLEPHTANSPVVIKPESGSTTDDVLEIQSEDGSAITTFDNSGGLQVDSFAVGCEPSGVSGEAKIGTILPCDSSSANVMRLPSGSSAGEIVRWQDSTGSLQGYISNAGLLSINRIFASIDTRSPIYQPFTTAADLKLQLRDDTKNFAFQDSSGSDTFTFSLDGDDRVMSFVGGTNTGIFSFDDGTASGVFKLNKRLDVTGSVISTGSIYGQYLYGDFIADYSGTGTPSATYWFTDGTADDATVTATATLNLAQHFVKIDSNDGSSTPITLTLPTAVGNSGKIYTFKVIDYQGTITIQGDGTETIDDSNTYTGLSAQYDSIRVVSDGTEWWIF